MLPILFILLSACSSKSSGLRGNPQPLSDSSRKQILDGLNAFRGSLGSSNMQCLSSWSSEMEEEAQKIADECILPTHHEKYGIGSVYTSDEVMSVIKYVELVSQYQEAVYNSSRCPCVDGKEAQCNNFKQFAHWEGGKFGCAISKCAAPPNILTMVMVCLFEKRSDSAKCPYAEGQECSFCSNRFKCVNSLCCNPAEPVGGNSCGSKPGKLVPLYKLYDRSGQYAALTASSEAKAQLMWLGYLDNGTLGYISPNDQTQCTKLKPLMELGSYSRKELFAYVVDSLLVSQMSKNGYFYRGIVGYVVEEEGFCSSTITAYNFGLPNKRNLYVTSESEAKALVSERGDFAPVYMGKPFALWSEK
uniref:SCP domain-containing protein n=1 Tax=Trichuris muris TaxID=70415 RepID=A0A5S6QWE3_TRIMR